MSEPIKLANFEHCPGKHCGSTALCDVSRYRAAPLSEAFCFGLGSGLGFFSFSYDKMKPSAGMLTRALNLEGNFFQVLGFPFQWHHSEKGEEALSLLKQYLQAGTPVLLQLDLYYLPYYHTQTHFPGHVVVCVGLDEAQGKVWLADTHFPDWQELSFDNLLKGWSAKTPPVPLFYNHFPVPDASFPKITAEMVKKALLQQARDMLAQGDIGFGAYGIAAMEKMFQEIHTWQERKDADFCFRFAYQVIEKRGTGGGAFRLLYSQFLEEAEQRFPPLASYAFSKEMKVIAEEWQEIALLFKHLSEQVQAETIEACQHKGQVIASQERSFYEKVLHLFT